MRSKYGVLTAWSVDPIGRSLTDLLSTLQERHAFGVDLYLPGKRSIQDAGETSLIRDGLAPSPSSCAASFQERVRAGKTKHKLRA